jgi:murein L,D-transpeptidase YafK
MNPRFVALLSILALAVALIPFRQSVRRYARATVAVTKGQQTVGSRLDSLGDAARDRMLPHFDAADVSYPPTRMVMVALKQERVLELWASDEGKRLRKIRTYEVLGASGRLGPKLREGDHQVPEGVYRIEYLNPNSRFHLSLKLNYPNAFDRHHAEAERRDFPGTDIFIHGSSVSIGCLAMGDPVAEELFVLTADIGRENVKVVIAPVDFRTSQSVDTAKMPEWTDELYTRLRYELPK